MRPEKVCPNLLLLLLIAGNFFELVFGENACPAKYRAIVGTSSFCLWGNKYVKNQPRGVSADDIKVILDTHNAYRGKVLPEPKMMMKMYWDDEAARIAQNLADRCKLMEHDSNMERMIPGKYATGQNLAYGAFSWADAVKLWYDEIPFFDWTTGKSKPGTEAGHFTQVVWASTIKVGCGMATCAFDGNNGLNHVCNYAPAGNEPNAFGLEFRPFVRGKRGEDCGSNYDSVTGLCDCGGKVCLNGGVLDPKTCTCKCTYAGGMTLPWVSGDDCQLDCTRNPIDFPNNNCEAYDCKTTAIYDMCPIFCNLCPPDGIKYKNGIVADRSLPRGPGTQCDFTSCYSKWTWNNTAFGSSPTLHAADFRYFIFSALSLVTVTALNRFV